MEVGFVGAGSFGLRDVDFEKRLNRFGGGRKGRVWRTQAVRMRLERYREPGHSAELNLGREPMRRVAVIIEPTPFTHVSGYSNRFKTLLQYLREAGDQVLVITPDNDPEAPHEYAGARIVNIPGFRFPLYKHITVSFGIRKVWGALREFNPDVIHLSTPGFMVFTTMIFARILRVPLLFSYHTHLPQYARSYGLGVLESLAWLMIRTCHNRADATLATSPQLCEELVQNGVERVGLWRKGVDTNIFNPRFRSPEMRLVLSENNPQKPLLLYVGRVGAEKNLSMLRKIFDFLPDVRLAIVGDGPFRETLQEELKNTPTFFAGLLTGQKLSEAYASADVFLMPSLSETLGFVVLESMASGVPVVGARAGGIPDLINHGITSYLFEPNNVEELCSYTRILINDSEQRQKMAQAGVAEAQRWNWKAATAVTRNVHYRRALKNFRFRALWGLGLPRSLTWLRLLRRRVFMVLVGLRDALFPKVIPRTS